jgi:hypothetical protein
VRGGHVNYNPDTRRLAIGYAAVAGLLALAYRATGGHPGVIYIQPQAGDARFPVFSIDAGQVIVTDDTVSSTVAENITEIEVVGQVREDVWVSNPAAQAPASGTNVSKIDTVSNRATVSAVYAVPGANPGVTTRLTIAPGIWSVLSDRAGNALVGLAREWIDFVQSVNGMLTTPGVRFDLHRWNYGADFETAILKPITDRRPIYFPGSEYAELTALVCQQQPIGGTIGYEGGYYAEPVFAPAAGSPATTQLTIGQLVTNTTPTMGEYDPAISLADWGTISIGLS